jgi:hypothetical protein
MNTTPKPMKQTAVAIVAVHAIGWLLYGLLWVFGV